jgi:hypothetical protein
VQLLVGNPVPVVAVPVRAGIDGEDNLSHSISIYGIAARVQTPLVGMPYSKLDSGAVPVGDIGNKTVWRHR